MGDSWRKRYDSLMLFTPRSYSALSGLPLDSDADGYASRDEFAAYLQTYAQYFQLPIRLNTLISRLEQVEGGFCTSIADNARLESRAVVLATGAFQKPAVPAIAAHFSADVAQFTAANYRNPAQVPPGSVVVVGDGATGRDIANELSTSHKVFLATGKPRRLLPDRVLGRSVWWWFDRLGLLAASADSRIGQFIRKRDPFPGRGKDFTYLRHKGVQIVGRLSQVDEKKAIFATGELIEADAVVWATGYTDDSDWVAIPEIKDARGHFIHQDGATAVPNLYCIGRPWQRSRGSALITGVGADAAFVAARIAESLDRGQLSNHRVGAIVDD